ncbi:MAG: low molecular weight protein-tyrosine-phosphatase [Limisphaerales bacterium]
MREGSRSIRRILFVCMGNICRSPAAEGVFQSMIADAGVEGELTCDSAGTIDYHRGQPADARMRTAALKRGYELQSKARQVTPEDLETFDLVLTMDEDNRRDVLTLDPEGKWSEKIRSFCDFVPSPESHEVPDPYYGGNDGFDRVLDLLEQGCRQLLVYCRSSI